MNRHTPLFPLLALSALVFAAAPEAPAQLPAARTTALFPPGAKAGTSAEVAVTGFDLDDVAEMRFSHPDITAKKASGGGSQTEAKFDVTVGADVPPGLYEARVVGRFGVTNPRAFSVEAREVASAKPATNPDGPTKLALDHVAFARATANAVDFWSFDAKQGQRLLIECDARAIDSKTVPDLTLLDAAGRELARSRRTGLLDIAAPADGTYTLRLSDLLYRGGPEFAYRLCVSTGPRIDAVFPNVAKRGAKGAFTLLGRNLPGGTPSKLTAADGRPLDELRVEIDVPADVPAAQSLAAAGIVGPSGAALDGFAYRLPTDKGPSNAVAILLADADVTPEAESAQPGTARNDAPADAQRLTLPAEVAGRFHPRNDRDVYLAEAKKGETWVLEVVSERLGQPTAVSLVVQKVAADGTAADVVASPDDEPATPGGGGGGQAGPPPVRTTTRDPILRWEVKEDAVYRLSLRDRFATAADDPARGYRLSVRKPAPDFAVVAAPMPAATADATLCAPLLRKGGTALLRVHVLRRDGHTGDVTVRTEGLPPGVSCAPATVGGAEASGLLVLTAAADAAPGAAALRLVATGKGAGDADVTRAAACTTVVWGVPGDGKNVDQNRNIDPIVSRLVRDSAVVGVCADEAEPVAVAAAEQKVYEVEAGQKLSVPLKVTRTVELKQGLKLKPVGLDALRNAKELSVDAKKDEATLELDLSQTKLPPGTHTFVLVTPVQFKYTRPAGAPPASAPSGEEKKDKDKEKPKDKKNEAKDVTTVAYSAPITIRVLPAAEKSEKSEKK